MLKNWKLRGGLRRLARIVGPLTLLLSLGWLAANLLEWTSGRRVVPWSAYGDCGVSAPAALPATVRIGLYEEFPTPERLARLAHIDFPVRLAVAAPTRAAFLELRADIQASYPQVEELIFWPVLSQAEGYYPGPWSDAEAVRRVAGEASGLPVLWDLEMPQDKRAMSLANRLQNGPFIESWLRERQAPVHVWRSNPSMGFSSRWLDLMGMHLDPAAYAQLWLHLDLYHSARALPEAQLAQAMRCGVERYGQRFVPALGVLDDGEGGGPFIPLDTFRRHLELARAAGSAEIWLFGLNGLRDEYLAVLRDVLDL